MKHIASLREGDVVKYALVDEETGELMQFAQLQVPDHFDFAASALLGTNLATVLGLDGVRPKPKAKVIEVQSPPPEEVKRGPGRPPKAGTPPPPPGPKPKNRQTAVEWFIDLDDVLRIVANYPDGVTCRQVGERLWRASPTWDGEDEPPVWIVKTVENRINSARYEADKRGETVPFRTEAVHRVKQDGTPSALTTRLIFPVAGTS